MLRRTINSLERRADNAGGDCDVRLVGCKSAREQLSSFDEVICPSVFKRGGGLWHFAFFTEEKEGEG